METTQRNISVQVQFWSLLGPFVALVTLMVIFVKASPQAFYLSFATILGVLASWRWKERGFLLSCLTVLVLYLYRFSAITPDEHLWHIGMSIAMTLGFGITALAYQEVDSILEEDKEDTEELDKLRLALQTGEETLQRVQQEIAAKQHQIESYSRLVETARQEVAKISEQHQKLVKDFLDKQLECAQLQENVRMLNEQKLLSSDLEETVAKREEEVQRLKEQLQELEHDVSRRLHMEKLEYEQILHDAIRDKEQIEALLMGKEQDLAQKQALIQHLEKELQKANDEKTAHMQMSVEELATGEMRRLDGMHKQLKEQFEDKSATLDVARKELFHTQEKLFSLEKMCEEVHVYGTDEETQALQAYLKQVIQESECSIAKLETEVAHLQDIIKELFSKI